MSRFDRLARRFAETAHVGPIGLRDDSVFAPTERRPAAVLVAITDRPEPGLLLTHRPHTMTKHPGQIAFPGGKLEPGEDAVAAALREAEEELGIDPAQVQVIGAATTFITGSGFELTPVLGLIPPDLAIRPDPREVADWFEAPLRHVLDAANHVAARGPVRAGGGGAGRAALYRDRLGASTASGASPPGSSSTCRTGWRGRNWSMARLPAAEWTQRDDLAQLVAALGAENVRWVGGAVRDTLLGLPVKDIDAATPLTPDEVIARLNRRGSGPCPPGSITAPITALLAGGPVEVTTLRHDVSTDGRRATDRLRQRLAGRCRAARFHHQRALCRSADAGDRRLLWRAGRSGGATGALHRRCSRTRIREDHLRILRYYRFQARFGAELDAEGEHACAELAPMLKGLSRERVAMELLAILALPDPHGTLARMFAQGVLPVVLPEVADEGLAALERLIAHEAAQGVEPSAIRRLGGASAAGSQTGGASCGKAAAVRRAEEATW